MNGLADQMPLVYSESPFKTLSGYKGALEGRIRLAYYLLTKN